MSMLSTKVSSTGNLFKHYHARHKGIPTRQHEAKALSATTTTNKPDFFRKYPGGLSQEKSRKLALNLNVSNNLQLSLVESVSFRA